MERLFENTIKKERIISYGPSYVQTKDGRKLRIHWNNTLLMDTERNVVGIATIGEDVTERWRAEKELQKNLKQMQALIDGTVEALAATAEKRDPYTAGHQRRVADLAYAIHALGRGLSEAAVRASIAGRDLSHKGSLKRQDDYIERTLAKARQFLDS